MFAPSKRKPPKNSGRKGNRSRDNSGAPEQLVRPQQMTVNSLRWHHLSVSFWVLVVADARRKVDAKGLQQFLDAMVWRIEGSISEAEFSQLYSVWLRPTNAQAEDKKKRPKRLSVLELRAVLALRKHSEADLDMMVSMLLFEQNRKILHTPLSQMEISFCTQEWISLVEQLFFHLDPAGFGYIFFDQIMFLCVCFLDIHPNNEMGDFVVASCAVLQLIKEMNGVIFPPQAEETRAAFRYTTLEARNVVTLSMMKLYMRGKGYSEASLAALLQVVELRLRTLHEVADRLGAAKNDVMRWFTVNQPPGKFTVPRCWEYVVAKSIGNQLGGHLAWNPFTAAPSLPFSSTNPDNDVPGYPSYVAFFAVDAPLYLSPELWLGAATDEIASDVLRAFAKQHTEDGSMAPTDPYLHLVQKIVSSYAIGVEQAFSFLQSIRINSDCEELRNARPLVPPPPDGMDILMRYDVSAEQFSQHPTASNSAQRLVSQLQNPEKNRSQDSGKQTSTTTPYGSTSDVRQSNTVHSTSTDSSTAQHDVPVPVHRNLGQTFEIQPTGAVEARPPPSSSTLTPHPPEKRAQKLQVNSSAQATEPSPRQKAPVKIISLRQIEAHTKDNLWPEEDIHQLQLLQTSRITPTSASAAPKSSPFFGTRESGYRQNLKIDTKSDDGARGNLQDPPEPLSPSSIIPAVNSLQRYDSSRFEPSVERQHEGLSDGSDLNDNNNASPVVRIDGSDMFEADFGPLDANGGEDNDSFGHDGDGNGNYSRGSIEELAPSQNFVPAPPSEHSAPSTVDELELYDQDAGRNAKALRAILRSMGKDNQKIDVAALANIIKLGNEIVTKEPDNREATAKPGATSRGIATRTPPTANRTRSSRYVSTGKSPNGTSPVLATRASRKAVPGRSPKPPAQNSSYAFGNRSDRIGM